MKFHTDHYFHIGSSHYISGKPCQDYALSSVDKLHACAIVSDGCSTGRYTDIGSRVLTLGTMQAIALHLKNNGRFFNNTVSNIASRQQKIIETVKLNLGLNSDDMLATCLYSYITKDEGVIHVQGDGVIAIKYLDGRISMDRFDWAKNAPFYPSYNDVDAKNYIINLHAGVYDTATMSHISLVKTSGGIIDNEKENHIPFDSARKGFLLHLDSKELASIEYIAVFTDGVTQIGNIPHGDDLIPWYDAVTRLLDFKSLSGEFAKRRMIREIRDLGKNGKCPIDDISYSAIRIEHEIEEEQV